MMSAEPNLCGRCGDLRPDLVRNFDGRDYCVECCERVGGPGFAAWLQRTVHVELSFPRETVEPRGVLLKRLLLGVLLAPFAIPGAVFGWAFLFGAFDWVGGVLGAIALPVGGFLGVRWLDAQLFPPISVHLYRFREPGVAWLGRKRVRMADLGHLVRSKNRDAHEHTLAAILELGRTYR